MGEIGEKVSEVNSGREIMVLRSDRKLRLSIQSAMLPRLCRSLTWDTLSNATVTFSSSTVAT